MENDHKSLSLREWRLLACRLCKPLVKLSNMSSLSKHLIALLISGCYWLDSGDTNVTQVDGDARKAPPFCSCAVKKMIKRKMLANLFVFFGISLS